MANAITCIRIVCALPLILLPAFSARWYLFYLLGGASDVLDGFAARHWGRETKLGTRLDTAADLVFTAAVLIKILRSVSLPLWLTVWIACIAVMKCGNLAGGFVLHKHFVSEHTVMNKLCGALLFLIPLGIGRLPEPAVAVLLIAACALCTVAAIQEGHYIRSGKEIR